MLAFYSVYMQNTNRITYRELDLVTRTPELLVKTTFYRNEQPLPEEEARAFIQRWGQLRRRYHGR